MLYFTCCRTMGHAERAALSFRVDFPGSTLEAYSPLCSSSSLPSHVVQIDLK